MSAAVKDPGDELVSKEERDATFKKLMAQVRTRRGIFERVAH